MLEHKSFSSTFTGFMRKGNYDRLINDVSSKVCDWVNAQGDAISVEHIVFSQSNITAHAVVFYRKRASA